MSELVSLLFDTKEEAIDARLAFSRMQTEHLVELEDLAVVYKGKNGRVRLDQTVDLTAAGAASGGFWGVLFGIIFSIPFGGPLLPVMTGVFGAGLGALGGSLSDYGINDNMMRQVGQGLDQGKAALFVLVRKATIDKVLQHLQHHRATVLRTSLSEELEQKLRSVVERASAPTSSAA
jgi:uncharacterized membrane protein